MKPLRAVEIMGTWAALLLPIDKDERIDTGRLGDELDVLIASGVTGVYSNGTAGEFYTQTEAEFDCVNALLAERCERAGVPFQIGASHSSPQIALERVRRARAMAPAAIQIVLPDWVPVTMQEATAFLQRVAEAADPVGLVLYNPPHAKRVLTPQEIGLLARENRGLVGVKVMSGDASWYAAMREHAGDLSVFVPGCLLATGYGQGASGAYSDVACLHPQGAQQWYELMKSDLDRALELEKRILRFIKEDILPLREEWGYSDPALDKCLAAIGNWASVGTRVRWPYRSVPESAVARLRPVARERIPELFPEG